MHKKHSFFSPIDEIVEEIASGKMVVIVDDESRENEGDLIFAGKFAYSDKINFMAKHGRGLICVPMTSERANHFELPLMSKKNSDHYGTAFTVSVDAAKGISTGISAHDRAHTVRVLSNLRSKKYDVICPGHLFPLIAKDGGVLVRAGHTEATVDLLRLAGIEPVGVICEIMNEDGTMARAPELVEFCRRHNLKMGSIAQIIEYRRKKEKLIKKMAETILPTKYGDFKLVVYESILDGQNHLALIKGKINGGSEVMVRVHSECLTGDVFGSKRCDCGAQLAAALRMIAKKGSGVLLYMRQEGRGIGLVNKLKAYELQDHGYDTVEANEKLGFKADLREYGIGAQILADIGAKKISLMTNNPRKIIGLEGYGIEIANRIPIHAGYTKHNKRYIKVKREKLGHMI